MRIVFFTAGLPFGIGAEFLNQTQNEIVLLIEGSGGSLARVVFTAGVGKTHHLFIYICMKLREPLVPTTDDYVVYTGSLTLSLQVLGSHRGVLEN